MSLFDHLLKEEVVSTFFVFIVIISAGALGGYIHYVFREEDPSIPEAEKIKEKKNELIRSMLLGIAAAFIVPVFLKISSGGGDSDIINQIVTPGKLQIKVSNLFVLGGFCQIAALSARKFLLGMSQNLLEKQGRKIKSTVLETEKIKQDMLELRDETIGESDEEAIDAPTSLEVGSLLKKINEDQKIILSELASKPNTKRSIHKIRTKVGWNREKTKKMLEELTDLNLAAVTTSVKDDKPRWKITETGVAAVRQIEKG